MNLDEIKKVLKNGIWTQNAGLVQLLGLCPLLAVSNSFINGLSLGLATTLVMTLSNGVISLLRRFIPNEIRIPVFILTIAVLVTVVDLLMNAYVHDLYLILGIFVPLIVTNCIVLARVEAFASKNNFILSLCDGFAMGLGLTLVLSILGTIREIIGTGKFLTGIDLILGESAQNYILTFIPNYQGFLLEILPAGAFITLGFLIALKNYIEQNKS